MFAGGGFFLGTLGFLELLSVNVLQEPLQDQ